MPADEVCRGIFASDLLPAAVDHDEVELLLTTSMVDAAFLLEGTRRLGSWCEWPKRRHSCGVPPGPLEVDLADGLSEASFAVHGPGPGATKELLACLEQAAEGGPTRHLLPLACGGLLRIVSQC